MNPASVGPKFGHNFTWSLTARPWLQVIYTVHNVFHYAKPFRKSNYVIYSTWLTGFNHSSRNAEG